MKVISISIKKLIQNVINDRLISETDVRTKFAVPFLKELGYQSSYQSNEFDVHSFSGGTENKVKFADIICFNSEKWDGKQKLRDTDWVKTHTLLVMELKKPVVKLDKAKFQAEFYSMNTRALFYVVTNGIEIQIFKTNYFSADSVFFEGKICDLSTNWTEIYSELSFSNVNSMKKSSNFNLKSNIFSSYCMRTKEIFSSQIADTFPQHVVADNNADEISPETLCKYDQNIIITGAPGIGKTTFLKQIFVYQCDQYLSGKSEKIPIFISAKFWNRSFNDIQLEFTKQVQYYIPTYNIDTFKNDVLNGNVLLIIDGMDEVFEDKDVLINQILHFNKSVIISSRYTDEFSHEFIKFEIPYLSEEEMTKVYNDQLKTNNNFPFLNIDSNLKLLLKRPLYLNMYIIFLRQKEQWSHPDNIGKLYKSFVEYLFSSYIKSKQNRGLNNIPTEVLNSILSDFAYNNLLKNHKSLLECINDNAFNYNQVEIKNVLIESGVIVESERGFEFDLFAIKEYFFASYISNSNADTLLDFIKQNCRNELFRQVILIILGSNEDFEQQQDVLDLLLEYNLPLYVRSLSSRFNFSKHFEKNKDINFYKSFFINVLKTYVKIIDKYFSAISFVFYPYRNSVSDEGRIGLDCSVNPETNSINIRCKLLQGIDDDPIKINFVNRSTPIAYMKTNDSEDLIQISTIKSSNGSFGYELNNIGRGIDYAREIAVDMIVTNLNVILKHKSLLPLESTGTSLFFIEDTLHSLNNYLVSMRKIDSKQQINIYEYSNDELIETIYDRYQDVALPIKLKNNLELALQLLKFNKLHDYREYSDCLFPKRNELPVDHVCSIYSYYSDEQIKKWVLNYYFKGELEYRHMCEKLFPNLKSFLPWYIQGPIKTNIDIEYPNRKEKDFFSGGVNVDFEPAMDENDIIPNFQIINKLNSKEDFDKHYEKIKNKSRFYNRPPLTHISAQVALSSIFDREKNPRSYMYELLTDDLEKVFNVKII